MAKLVCSRCGGEESVPKVHDGPGIPGKKEHEKLVCPTHGEGCMPIDIPRCCGTAMQYVG